MGMKKAKKKNGDSEPLRYAIRRADEKNVAKVIGFTVSKMTVSLAM